MVILPDSSCSKADLASARPFSSCGFMASKVILRIFMFCSSISMAAILAGASAAFLAKSTSSFWLSPFIWAGSLSPSWARIESNISSGIWPSSISGIPGIFIGKYSSNMVLSSANCESPAFSCLKASSWASSRVPSARRALRLAIALFSSALELASWSFCFGDSLSSSSRPLEISFCASSRLSLLSSSLLSTSPLTLALSSSNFSLSNTISIFFSITPEAVTEATPSILSKEGITTSLVKLDSSSISIPLLSILATIMGIISGLILSSMGEPAPSSSMPDIVSILFESSIITESMLVSWTYSSIIILVFSFDIELIFLRPLDVPRAASRGLVRVCSTFSGLAPG